MWLMWFISLRIIPLRELGIMHTLEIAYKKVVLGIYYSWKLSEGMYGFRHMITSQANVSVSSELHHLWI